MACPFFYVFNIVLVVLILPGTFANVQVVAMIFAGLICKLAAITIRYNQVRTETVVIQRCT